MDLLPFFFHERNAYRCVLFNDVVQFMIAHSATLDFRMTLQFKYLYLFWTCGSLSRLLTFFFPFRWTTTYIQLDTMFLSSSFFFWIWGFEIFVAHHVIEVCSKDRNCRTETSNAITWIRQSFHQKHPMKSLKWWFLCSLCSYLGRKKSFVCAATWSRSSLRWDWSKGINTMEV